MGPDQAVMSAIRVKVGVGVAMVGTVTARPPLDGTLYSASASHGQEVFERFRRVIRSVGPEPVVPGSDTETGYEIPKDGKECGLPLELGGKGTVERDERSDTDEHTVEVVELLPPAEISVSIT
jgi:hypothetical protein